MKTLPIFILLTLTVAINGFGQKTDTTYFDAFMKPSTKLSSSYFRVTKTIEEGKKYEIFDHLKSGELYMKGTFSSINPLLRDGEFNWYDDRGNVKARHFYKNNELQSELKRDQNGKLTLQKNYKKFDAIRDTKKTNDYVSVEKSPEFPGGISRLYDFINRKFKMPANVDYIPGKIVVRFTVDKDGNVLDPKIIKSVDPLIDEEVLRVIKMLPRWAPGVQNGKNISMMFNMPITID